MLKTIITALCCMASFCTCAQFTISGTIAGGEQKEHLQGATAILKGTGKVQVTDTDGKFMFTELPTGTYFLHVTYLGYRQYNASVVVNENVTLEILMEEAPLISDEIIVSALRAKENTPTTFTNVTKEEIAKQNYGQDLPFLLNWTPSLVTTSDAGTGVGYTGLRIRGSDASHINVTINGIPYNDSESQSVYWVDVPDVASSTQSVQIQRGVGTSSNGAGAFGGSVNLQTNSLQEAPYTEISNSYGSFNTHKHTIKLGTGLINKVWAFDGRISKIKSDGYIERASSDLDSYYLSGGYYGKNTLIKAIMFGGHELTYQSWYGIDPDMMKIDRRFNYAGAIYNDDGTVQRYYDRQVDDYKQDHYQLHLAHQINSSWNVNAALHYTYGRGFFEEYLQGRSYATLGLPNIILGGDTITSGDFVRRQWLDNRFYGATWSAHHNTEKMELTVGGAINKYGNAKHFGEIIWSQYAGPAHLRDVYYKAVSQKSDFNIYSKINYDFTNKLNGFLDLQYRRVGYESAGADEDLNQYQIDDTFNFFNPKAGLTMSLSQQDVLYSSYAFANREPTRADYLGGIDKPRSERLANLEAGWRRKSENYTLEVNYYLMNYKDQLVLTGKVTNGGYPVRGNVGKSYRTGLELSGSVKLSDKISWALNATFSQNKNSTLIVEDGSGSKVYKNTSIILSPNWIAGSQITWSPFSKVQLSLLSKYVGKQYLDNSEREFVSLKPYFLNDVRISYTIAPKFVKEIELGALLNNIFGTVYSSNGAVYANVPYFYPQAGRNFMLRVGVKF